MVMADQPADRTTPSLVHLNVTIDYTGHVGKSEEAKLKKVTLQLMFASLP